MITSKPMTLAEVSGTVLEQLPKGILLTTQDGDVRDTMTIGWGGLGTNWGMDVFTVYVRESRFTKTLLDANPVFTISCPMPGMDVRSILGFCGTKSGRDVDKFEACHLHTVPGEEVCTPAILELPLTIECQVLYAQKEDPASIPSEIRKHYYPEGDNHTMYIAHIKAVYLLQNDEQ